MRRNNGDEWPGDVVSKRDMHGQGADIPDGLEGEMIAQEYYTEKELARVLGYEADPSRMKTFRQRIYSRRIPGQIKIFGRWQFRIMDVQKALLNEEL